MIVNHILNFFYIINDKLSKLKINYYYIIYGLIIFFGIIYLNILYKQSALYKKYNKQNEIEGFENSKLTPRERKIKELNEFNNNLIKNIEHFENNNEEQLIQQNNSKKQNKSNISNTSNKSNISNTSNKSNNLSKFDSYTILNKDLKSIILTAKKRDLDITNNEELTNIVDNIMINMSRYFDNLIPKLLGNITDIYNKLDKSNYYQIEQNLENKLNNLSSGENDYLTTIKFNKEYMNLSTLQSQITPNNDQLNKLLENIDIELNKEVKERLFLEIEKLRVKQDFKLQDLRAQLHTLKTNQLTEETLYESNPNNSNQPESNDIKIQKLTNTITVESYKYSSILMSLQLLASNLVTQKRLLNLKDEFNKILNNSLIQPMSNSKIDKLNQLAQQYEQNDLTEFDLSDNYSKAYNDYLRDLEKNMEPVIKPLHILDKAEKTIIDLVSRTNDYNYFKQGKTSPSSKSSKQTTNLSYSENFNLDNIIPNNTSNNKSNNTSNNQMNNSIEGFQNMRNNLPNESSNYLPNESSKYNNTTNVILDGYVKYVFDMVKNFISSNINPELTNYISQIFENNDTMMNYGVIIIILSIIFYFIDISS